MLAHFKIENHGIISEFPRQAIFENGINESFLVLIPKKVDTMDVRYFRPISLVGEVCKIIFSVLANRPESVLHGVISKPIMLFVINRQILDSISIVNE